MNEIHDRQARHDKARRIGNKLTLSVRTAVKYPSLKNRQRPLRNLGVADNLQPCDTTHDSPTTLNPQTPTAPQYGRGEMQMASHTRRKRGDGMNKNDNANMYRCATLSRMNFDSDKTTIGATYLDRTDSLYALIYIAARRNHYRYF